MSFDRGDRERELTSKLLSEAYPQLLTTNDIGKGENVTQRVTGASDSCLPN